MRNKIIVNLIFLVFLGLFSCSKDPIPRTIKGTIIDTVTNSTINYTTITIDRKYNYKFNRLAMDFNAVTDTNGFFSCPIEAKKGDVITIYFGNLSRYITLLDTPIYKFTITKDKEYNFIIKTQKP